MNLQSRTVHCSEQLQTSQDNFLIFTMSMQMPEQLEESMNLDEHGAIPILEFTVAIGVSTSQKGILDEL